jgi:hypothetical protein
MSVSATAWSSYKEFLMVNADQDCSGSGRALEAEHLSALVNTLIQGSPNFMPCPTQTSKPLSASTGQQTANAPRSDIVIYMLYPWLCELADG